MDTLQESSLPFLPELTYPLEHETFIDRAAGHDETIGSNSGIESVDAPGLLSFPKGPSLPSQVVARPPRHRPTGRGSHPLVRGGNPVA